MDLQGIGALTASGVALAACGTTLVVGRLQARAVLRASAHTARVSRAQAASSYEAALDAVRAQGVNEHHHWRRGIQRDAYAAFLQSVLIVTEHSNTLHVKALNEPLEVRDVIIASKPLTTDMSHKNWVVRLEGPDEVSNAAKELEARTGEFLDVAKERAVWNYGLARLQQLRSSHPQEVERIRDYVARVAPSYTLIGTPDFPAEADQALSALRRLLNDMQQGELLVPLVRRPALQDLPRTHLALNEAIETFLAAARRALHTED
ncbi:hypothetical protein ACQPXT_13240 [Streptomyces sp. CA-100214]